MMDIQKIKELALANGFSLKPQASGNMDLNAYVYDFANAVEREVKAQAVPEGFVLIKASDRDQEMLELIDQRDHMESQAEKLKDKLQALYGVDFGEHSSCNFPFQNAIDYDDSDLVLVKREKLAIIFETATNALVYHAAPPKHDALSIIQGIARKVMIEAQESAND